MNRRERTRESVTQGTPGASRTTGGPSRSVRSLSRWVRPRRWRLIGLSLGMLCLFIVWVVETHATRSVAPLGVILTVVALVVLIGAGNLLEGWMGIKHRSPEYTERKQRPEDTTAP